MQSENVDISVQIVLVATGPGRLTPANLVLAFVSQGRGHHLEFNIGNGSVQYNEGVYQLEIDVEGTLPALLVERLMSFRGFRASVDFMGPYPVTSIEMVIPRMELIQLNQDVMVGRCDLNEASNLEIEMAQANHQSQMRHFGMMRSPWHGGGQPRDREAIGNTQCKFNALSRHLRCAVRPEAETCSGCGDFEKRV